MTIDNSIIAGNVATGTAVGPVEDVVAPDGGVIGADDLGSGLGFTGGVSGDANLGPLADNGGPTRTMALMFPGAAVAAGSAALEVDARGHPLTGQPRGDPVDTPAPDIGASRRPAPSPRHSPTCPARRSPTARRA